MAWHLYLCSILGVTWGLYRDNGKEHGNYCLGFSGGGSGVEN